MPEGAVAWTCPRCGDQNGPHLDHCARCGAAPSPFAVPPKRCPGCRTEFDEPALEGLVHCPKCGREFEDYEEWVRRCRAAAFAATRPAPPPAEEPPPRPAHLRPLAGGLLAMAAFYAASGLVSGRPGLLAACLVLAALQAVAGTMLFAERRHADAFVRLAAGLSVLVPVFLLPAIFFIALFAYFSRPEVAKYFGGRADPAPDGLRHSVVAWMIVSTGVLAGLYATVFAVAMEQAAAWNDPPVLMMEIGRHIVGFFTAGWWWAPAGVLGGLIVLALWGRYSRHGFIAGSILGLLALAGFGVPPLVEAWITSGSVLEAESYRDERDINRLVWGARHQDPRVRIVAMKALAAVGRDARDVMPALARTIKDPDRRVRLTAACALAQFDPSIEDVLPILIATLEDDRSIESEKNDAARALGYFGPRARPALSPLLDRLRRGDAATLALVELGPASIPGLAEALSDRDPAVRRRAARALRLHGPGARSAAPALLERFKDADPGVRAEAALAYGEIQREKAVPALQELLASDASTAAAAAQALCALGQRDGFSKLPQGCSAMNAVRQPTVWDHLSKTFVDKDVEGTGQEILVTVGERIYLCPEIPPECAELPEMKAFRRIHASSRKRSVLEILNSFDLDYILESDRIRIVPRAQAAAFWSDWMAEARKKK